MKKGNWRSNLMLLGALGLALTPALMQASPKPPVSEKERLARDVRHELVMLPFYSLFDNLSFRIDGGTVTLLGQVTRPTLKTSAARVVERIPGVSKVTNQIEVLPLSSFDDRIRMAVLRAMYRQPTLQRYGLGALPSIHIIVKNGDVSLEGVVSSEMDKNLAYLYANGVPGVFSVTNNLRVM
jgi:hyperosmotically inducible periplasmic protein